VKTPLILKKMNLAAEKGGKSKKKGGDSFMERRGKTGKRLKKT